MQQPTMEKRVASLESEVEALKRLIDERIDSLEQGQDSASAIDRALLDRIDRISSDLRTFKRDTQRGFENQAVQLREIQWDLKQTKETVTALIDTTDNHTNTLQTLIDAARDHKQGIESLAGQVNELAGNVGELAGRVGELAMGQQHMLELLRGNARRDD